jgi:hypothetical protein
MKRLLTIEFEIALEGDVRLWDAAYVRDYIHEAAETFEFDTNPPDDPFEEPLLATITAARVVSDTVAP